MIDPAAVRRETLEEAARIADSSVETVKAAIAGTRDPGTGWTLLEVLNDWNVRDLDDATDQDVAYGRNYADRMLTEAARRAIEAMPEADRLTRDLAEACAERDAARAVLLLIEEATEDRHCPLCDRWAKGSEPHKDWCPLAAALAPSTPPDTPIAAGQAGEPMHHNQFATDLVRNAALEEAARVADGFTCGACGMDGKAGKAIRALTTRDTESAPAEPAAGRDGGGGE